MNPDNIHKLVRLAYEAYDRGERNFVVDLLHDDVVWIMHSPPEVLPVPNRIAGKQALLSAFQRIDEVVEVLRNDVLLVIVENDWAAVICDRTLRQRATGRIMRYKVAAFHRYRDGRLIEYQGFADSIDMLEQSIGKRLDLPPAFPVGPP